MTTEMIIEPENVLNVCMCVRTLKATRRTNHFLTQFFGHLIKRSQEKASAENKLHQFSLHLIATFKQKMTEIRVVNGKLLPEYFLYFTLHVQFMFYNYLEVLFQSLGCFEHAT